MMNKDEQSNFEILSKIVIQLKTSQIETTKKLNEEIANIKNEMSSENMMLREKYDKEVMSLKEEINELKLKSAEREKNYISEVSELKNKLEKSVIELREDMLKLLKKYEDKFHTQDDEIEVLKSKCEMVNCRVCGFQSFKVHFFNCGECQESICSNCLQVCKNCRKTECLNCLNQCNVCQEKLCKECSNKCSKCEVESCKDCFDKCFFCNAFICRKCLIKCRKCEKLFCEACSAKCEKCSESVSCKSCFEKDFANEKCICGRLYCFNCEDDCVDCAIPSLWENQSRIFQGFHTKSAVTIPDKSLVKFYVINKGIDTTHLGLTSDTEFKSMERATENFWSLCLNSGEKFSTSDYKKKGIPWAKYSVPVKTGDTVYLKYLDGEVRFLINRKEYPIAFQMDKSAKYFLYCLTHDDSTQIEIKSLKVYK